MSKVFVLDTEKRPLNPIHSAQARQLLRNGKAAVFRRFPFTIILKESKPDAIVQPLRLKIDFLLGIVTGKRSTLDFKQET